LDEMSRIMQFAGALVLAAGMALNGCAYVPSASPAAYPRSEVRQSQQVQFGQVIAVQPVQIEGTKSGLGPAIGAVAGGLATGYATKNSSSLTKALGGLGGAVAGGMIGTATEEGLTRQGGLQITVRLENGRTVAVTQGAQEQFSAGERVQVLTSYDGTMRVTH
jgi:outer membrane lipoprotein SlyB